MMDSGDSQESLCSGDIFGSGGISFRTCDSQCNGDEQRDVSGIVVGTDASEDLGGEWQGQPHARVTTQDTDEQ